jgi:hypothetical protein
MEGIVGGGCPAVSASIANGEEPMFFFTISASIPEKFPCKEPCPLTVTMCYNLPTVKLFPKTLGGKLWLSATQQTVAGNCKMRPHTFYQ